MTSFRDFYSKVFMISAFSVLLMTSVVEAQDIIIKANGAEIKARVEEINDTEVKYRKFENLNGPLYSILKKDIRMIKYENGTEDVFSEPAPVPPQQEQQKKKKKQKQPEQQPAQQPPTEQQPAQQPPTEQKPAQQPPTEQKPAQQPPTEQKPAQQQPEKQQPTEQKPAQQPPTEQKPAQQPPTEQKPAQQPPTEQKPAQQQQQPANQVIADSVIYLDEDTIIQPKDVNQLNGIFSMTIHPLGALQFGPMLEAEYFVAKNISLGLNARYPTIGVLYQAFNNNEKTAGCFALGASFKYFIPCLKPGNYWYLGTILQYESTKSWGNRDEEWEWKGESSGIACMLNGGYRLRYTSGFFINMGVMAGAYINSNDKWWYLSEPEEVYDQSSYLLGVGILEFGLGYEFNK